MDNKSIETTKSNRGIYSDEFFNCNLMMRNLMGLQIQMNFEARLLDLIKLTFLGEKTCPWIFRRRLWIVLQWICQIAPGSEQQRAFSIWQDSQILDERH